MYLLLYQTTVCIHSAWRTAWLQLYKGWMDIMKSLLGIILRSKCKFRKGVKALRKLLPTWLALMNSSQRFRQIPKWSIASMRLRWLITLLNVFLFFKNTSFNLKKSYSEPVMLLVWNSAVNSSAEPMQKRLVITTEAKPCFQLCHRHI